MAEQQRKPSVIGCAVGFGAAGSGVGSLAGSFAWESCRFPLFEGQAAQAWADYGGTLLGIVLGSALGAALGVWYARRARSKSVDTS